jgi:hypothetical protein
LCNSFYFVGLGLAKGNDALNGLADEVYLCLEIDSLLITLRLGGGRVLGRIVTMLAGILVARRGAAARF